MLNWGNNGPRTKIKRGPCLEKGTVYFSLPTKQVSQEFLLFETFFEYSYFGNPVKTMRIGMLVYYNVAVEPSQIVKEEVMFHDRLLDA